MKRIAITGGIACGKSLFCRMMATRGGLVLDTDEVSHTLTAAGGEAVPILARRFGDKILDGKGGIDRPEFARIFFSNREIRAEVESILHPMIRMRVERWLAESDGTLRVVAVPLLFEIGWDKDWDYTICLVSEERDQIERMIRTRGYTEAEARRRIAAQLPVAEKAAKSDWAVWNLTDLSALERQADRIFDFLQEI